LLSIFRSIYDFKSANLHRRARLWKSAAAECEWASHLLVLCESDLRKPWSGHITVSDACLSGTATCAMETDPRVVQQVGQGRELWRFRSSLPSKKARDTVLSLDPFKDLETALPWDAVYDPFQLNHEFQNVPREIALSADWKVMFSARRLSLSWKVGQHYRALDTSPGALDILAANIFIWRTIWEWYLLLIEVGPKLFHCFSVVDARLLIHLHVGHSSYIDGFPLSSMPRTPRRDSGKARAPKRHPMKKASQEAFRHRDPLP
jgi:hypothetical protein